MSRSLSELRRFLVAAFLLTALPSCFVEAGEPVFQRQLTGLEYEFFDEDEGVHPSDVVLANPNNPFRWSALGENTKFEVLANGGAVGTFYIFATELAREPTGEHQYYAALGAQRIVESGTLDFETENLLRDIAVRGFQSVLDNFPDSRSFFANGITSFDLATPSLIGIFELGGLPQGDWALVLGPGPNPDDPPRFVAVRQAGDDSPRPEPSDPPEEVPTPGFGDEEGS